MPLSRRKFIQTSALASASGLLPGFLSTLKNRTSDGHRILILIALSGGNDALNTVIPFRDEIYYRARPDLSIHRKKVLQLHEELGLHPALSGLKALYDEGMLGILNDVGYPRSEHSHSRSLRIRETASDDLHTGWVGRYLDLQEEAAIEADHQPGLILKGEKRSGHTLTEWARLYPDFKTRLRHSGYPDYPDNIFGEKLKRLAELIISGCPARIYHLSLGSFDTHINQKLRQNQLFTRLGNGLHSFMKDLKKKELLQNVMIVTYSEFGRGIAQNDAGGTEHGNGGCVFLVSGSLKKQGVLNAAPDLSHFDPKNSETDELICKMDFRRIYATLLHRWLQTDDRFILKGAYSHLDFI